jgi:quinol monooxygenase YgiN
MALIAKTTFTVKSESTASFLADFGPLVAMTKAAPGCSWAYVAEGLDISNMEDVDETADVKIEVLSCWSSEDAFDSHIRWRIGTERWSKLEERYLTDGPRYSLMPVMFAFE